MSPEGVPVDGSRLCLACGLCCQEILHDWVKVESDEVGRMEGLGLSVTTRSQGAGFSLPCPCYREGRCAEYANRPRSCRSYQCKLLRRHLTGEITWEEALKRVEQAKRLIASIRGRLGAPGNGMGIWQQLRSSPVAAAEPELRMDAAALLALCKRHFWTRAEPTNGPRLMSRFFGTVDLADARDGGIRLVGDLRLDNREELISLLDGVTGASSDADVALAAYLRWGESCPRHLLGDFAIAVWDAHLRKLLLACDPLGVKPLHYARTGHLLVFASEAQQVLQHPAVPRCLDKVTVGDFLAGRSGEIGRTFFQNVRRLPSAHLLVATPEAVRIERFWDLPEDRIFYRHDEDYTAHFLELFQQSVEDRLGTESGPVGVLMSGGLDSCSVAAVAHRVLSRKKAPRLFAGSFVFDKLQECDERQQIRTVAAHLGLETELVPAESFQVFAGSEAFLPSLEEPFTAWEGCFREMTRRVQNRGARVLLTGHGGDDLLAGSVLIYSDRLRRGDLRPVLEVARYAVGRGRAWRGSSTTTWPGRCCPQPSTGCLGASPGERPSRASQTGSMRILPGGQVSRSGTCPLQMSRGRPGRQFTNATCRPPGTR